MRLARESRYAIEALVVLAGRPAGELVDAREIAAEAGLPVAYLRKILGLLVRAGVVESRRGKGYRLARRPDRLSVHEVIAAVEGDGTLSTPCIFWREECSEEDPCELHFMWQGIKPALESAIARTTIAEVLERGAVRAASRS